MGNGGAAPMEVEMGEDDARNPTAQFLIKGERRGTVTGSGRWEWLPPNLAPNVSHGHESAAKARLLGGYANLLCTEAM